MVNAAVCKTAIRGFDSRPGLSPVSDIMTPTSSPPPLPGRSPARPAEADGLQTVRLGPFTTEAGARLPDVTVGYRTWGTLDADAANAVVVCHALTGDTDAAADAVSLAADAALAFAQDGLQAAMNRFNRR